MQVYPKTDRIEDVLLKIVGMEGDRVKAVLDAFVNEYEKLNPNQLRFLDLLRKHIEQYGPIKPEKLWDAPFTGIHSEGVDGVFPDSKQVDRLIELVKSMG